ncbi:TPA: bifunctional (p)ppGpp synthetase/guanosine-3',5'-bis(diphosphate) 3'-pyrophosphohydrolase [Candidatus Woesearchaeota archaeon]|nr:bifunctional (p)ppGpp synthetase/guanosine-3',5'-bis(diphosphate) 3'-pyrophosphohydrolase [Candidatus Woesearchaeota archaeon]
MNEQQFLLLCSDQGYDQKTLFLIEEALSIAKEHLDPKKRLSGDTYYEHNIRVSAILVENKSPPELVIAALLTGVSSPILKKQLQAQFGDEVIFLLLQLEALKSIKVKNKNLDSENLRKVILTTLQDVRVILIKIANKLDNLRTLAVFPKEEQRRLAEEVLEIYAPLAYRLGSDKLRVQLEDRAFQILEPQEFDRIQRFVQDSAEQRERNVQYAITEMKKICAHKVEIINIKGRSKHLYSIYKKIKLKKESLQDLHDLTGIRIIVKEVKDCYITLGLLHEHFEPIEGRLKDYITNPKPNFYRSIHTGLKLPNGLITEVQIRTEEMDEWSEEGIAAHWRYKGVKSDQLFEKKIAWLRNLLNVQHDIENKEFLETIKVDLFGDEIYCYTPKGDVKELPKGATVLDFAYIVHEHIGNQCVGARVNGQFVPIKHELHMGDIIEVVTNKNQRPRRSWVKIVRSARARQKIRKSLKQFESLAPLHYRTLKPALNEEQGILVEAPDNPHVLCVLAKCCSPLPGELIRGFVTKRRLVSVHRPDCKESQKEERNHIAVSWKNSFNQPIQFVVKAEERSGLLADLLHTIASAGFEVREAKAKFVDAGHAHCSFKVIPRDLEHLQNLLLRLRKIKGVQKIMFD